MIATNAVALLLLIPVAEQHHSDGRHRCSSTATSKAAQHDSNGRHRCSSTATSRAA
ncbi:hypothetical protein PF008_g25863 [Phytophthora fragariae]|nr:hypothetical protein PF008_g25863 [Phytophthora fragariae]